MKSEMRYVPKYNRDADSAFAQWQKEYAEWLAGEHDRVIAEYGEADYPKDQPYASFCRWHGPPPDPKRYLPKWSDEEMTWYQVYETVSEGTPVTPPFATREELVEYLVEHGDFWDQSRREEKAMGKTISMNCDPWSREAAERFVFGTGWAPSMMVDYASDGSLQIKTAKDGI